MGTAPHRIAQVKEKYYLYPMSGMIQWVNIVSYVPKKPAEKPAGCEILLI
jgi:hypothetical protein